MKNSFKERLIYYSGAAMVAIGIIFNQWFVEIFFSSDGSLINASKIALWFINGLLIAIGSLVIWKRSTILQFLIKITLLKILIFFGLAMMITSILEISLRYWLVNHAREQIFAAYATIAMIEKRDLRFSSHPYLAFYPSPNYQNNDGDRHNALGYRGEEITIPKSQDKFRIVTFGGSTTYSSEVKNYQESYPFQLQSVLHERGYNNIEVVNGGVPFYDSWSSLINLEFRLLDLEPDLLIYYEGDNEMKTRLVYPFSSYRGDNTGRIAAVEIPDLRIIDKFVISRILFRPLGLVADFADLASIHDAPTLVHHEYLKQLKSNSYPSGVFKSQNVDIIEILNTNKPIYSERNISHFAAISNYNNIPLILSSFAFTEEIGVRTKTEVYKQSILELNNIFREVALREKMLYYDFATVMPTTTEYWRRDGVHVNAKGARKKAELFADYLESVLVPIRYNPYVKNFNN